MVGLSVEVQINVLTLVGQVEEAGQQEEEAGEQEEEAGEQGSTYIHIQDSDTTLMKWLPRWLYQSC